MSVGLLGIRGVEKGLSIDIAGALNIHHSDIAGLVDNEAHFELLRWFGSQVELHQILLTCKDRNDFNPELNCAL